MASLILSKPKIQDLARAGEKAGLFNAQQMESMLASRIEECTGIMAERLGAEDDAQQEDT